MVELLHLFAENRLTDWDWFHVSKPLIIDLPSPVGYTFTERRRAPKPVVTEVPLELIVTILCTMSGALIGTAVGILLMFRRFRPPSQAELDTLRGNLQTVESSLAAATVVSENLRKQIAERDGSLHASSE